jgi:hypothetical protein
MGTARHVALFLISILIHIENIEKYIYIYIYIFFFFLPNFVSVICSQVMSIFGTIEFAIINLVRHPMQKSVVFLIKEWIHASTLTLIITLIAFS